MASREMVKRAYAEGAYAALKEAGYDDQTAEHYAIEMAKQADPGGIPAAPATPQVDVGSLLAQRKPAVPMGGTPRMQAALQGARGPKGLVPPKPGSLPPLQ